jgi:ankyrin repeat protein
MTFEEAAQQYPVLAEQRETLEKASLVNDPITIQKIAVYFIRKDTESFKKLIEQGLDIDTRETGDFGSPLLHNTVRYGNKEAFEFLLDNGADINALDNIHYTALTEAVVDGQLAFAEELVARGIDKTIPNTMGATAAALAQKFGRLEFLPLLG